MTFVSPFLLASQFDSPNRRRYAIDTFTRFYHHYLTFRDDTFMFICCWVNQCPKEPSRTPNDPPRIPREPPKAPQGPPTDPQRPPKDTPSGNVMKFYVDLTDCHHIISKILFVQGSYTYTYMYIIHIYYMYIYSIFVNEILATALPSTDLDLARFSDPIKIAQM